MKTVQLFPDYAEVPFPYLEAPNANTRCHNSAKFIDVPVDLVTEFYGATEALIQVCAKINLLKGEDPDILELDWLRDEWQKIKKIIEADQQPNITA